MQSRQLNQKNKSALNTSKNPKHQCLKIIPLGGLHEIGKIHVFLNMEMT